MTGKERLFLFSILLITMLLLPLTLKAASEEEMVQQFLAKNDAVKKHTMVAPFFSFSYGKVDPAGYHNFTGETNKYVRMVNSTDATALASIHRITSFEGGLSLLVDRGLLSAAFDYWLTVGSSKKGDFEFYTDLTAGTHEDVEDFNLRSEIKVWGVYLDYQYFFHNPPVPYFGIRGLSARAGAGIGIMAPIGICGKGLLDS